MLSIFIAHAPEDAVFVRELSAFLETGCDEIVIVPDTAIQPGQDLLSTAETGSGADVLVLLLSPFSNLSHWRRAAWEPVLIGSQDDRVRVSFFLLSECTFPPLMRRGSNFFNAAAAKDIKNIAGRLPAMRQLKRWIWGIRHGTSPAMTLSPDLESLYAALADRPGTLTASGLIAERFARQAVRDFEAVFWVPCHGRTLTQIAGDLGSQLQMTLRDPLENNCRRISDMLAGKRCLVVFDAPDVRIDPIVPSGRTSFLFTEHPVRNASDARTLPEARELISAGRFAEAYDVLCGLFNSGIETESCARELVWICEYWDRVEQANAFRFYFRPSLAEQMRLF